MKFKKEDIFIVSIRLMTFNHSDFILEALEGINSQKTNFNFEVVIGDDFSTDDSLEKIKKYRFTNENISVNILSREGGDEYWVKRQELGRLYNFTSILENCSGKYIALLDGDDYWTDTLKLQKQIDFLEGNPDFSLCFHNSEILNIRENKEVKTIMHKSLDKDVFMTKDLLCQWFVPTASIMFRNYDDFILPSWIYNCASGDIPLLLLLSLRGKFKYLDSLMSCYRLHDSGISIKHNGYFKVFSMIYIYQNFNIYSNYKFEEEITDAMIYEVRAHLPEIKELKKLKKQLIKHKPSLINRIMKKLMK